MKKLILIVTACITLLTAAQAHPTGHEDDFFETAYHLITQPDHLVMIFGALAVVGVVAFKLLRPAKK